MLNVICIIPARGGSKRLPGKNIALLNGKPLIAYSIEAWNKSQYCTHPAIVSTDSDDIRRLSHVYDAEVLLRPAKLALDDIPTIDVIRHVVLTLVVGGYRLQWVLILQPTSPLRTVEDIDRCLDIIKTNQYDSLTSICPVTSKYDTQENGAIYITSIGLIEQGRICGDRLYRYEMPPERSIDIDTAEDLAEAEKILKGDKNDNIGGVLHKLGRPGRSKKNDQSGKGKRSRTR